MAEADATVRAREGIQRLLGRMRTQLNLDVALVSEFADEIRVVRYVDAAVPEGAGPIRVGATDPREDPYWHYVATGELPPLVPDARRHPLTASLAVTDQLGIGSHLSVPITLADGTVYGTLCGFAYHVNPTLDDTQLPALRLMAAIVAHYLDEDRTHQRDLAARRHRLRQVVANGDLAMVVQPIIGLASGDLVGVEALARFPTLDRGPAEVFAEAWQVGAGLELELAAVDAAIDLLELLPDDVYLSVNVAPTTLASVAFGARAAALAPGRLVAEVTEHAVLADVDALVEAIQRLDAGGVRFAVDDLGTGFSGLERILQLDPDILKIDKALVGSIDTCPARHALVAALASFAACTATTIVAEGIETADELAALRALDIDCGQGYHLARPCDPHQLVIDRTGVDAATGTQPVVTGPHCDLSSGGLRYPRSLRRRVSQDGGTVSHQDLSFRRSRKASKRR